MRPHSRLYAWSAPWGRTHYVREGWRRTICGKVVGTFWVQRAPAAPVDCRACRAKHAQWFTDDLAERRREEARA